MEVEVVIRPGGGLRRMLLRELGLGPDASDEEVESAWRALAKRTHPDLGGDPAEFNRIRNLKEALDALRR